MSDFQVRLKTLREKRGLSQQAFADDFGVVQSTVGNWEAGKREPNFETVRKLASYFDVSVDYLIGDKEYRMESGFNGYSLAMLCVKYDANASIVAAVGEVNPATAEKWLSNELYPNEDQLSKLSAFFEYTDWKSCAVSLTKSADVQKRIDDLKLLRYPTLLKHKKYNGYDAYDLDEEAVKVACAFYNAKRANDSKSLDFVRLALSDYLNNKSEKEA